MTFQSVSPVKDNEDTGQERKMMGKVYNHSISLYGKIVIGLSHQTPSQTPDPVTVPGANNKIVVTLDVALLGCRLPILSPSLLFDACFYVSQQSVLC